MTDELKSCPFCGGKAELHRPSIAVYAICSKCGISTSYIYPPEEAVRRWNNRSAEDALQERIAKLEAERDRLREALWKIAEMEAGFHEPSFEMRGCMTSESCMNCDEMINIAREALKGAGE